MNLTMCPPLTAAYPLWPLLLSSGRNHKIVINSGNSGNSSRSSSRGERVDVNINLIIYNETGANFSNYYFSKQASTRFSATLLQRARVAFLIHIGCIHTIPPIFPLLLRLTCCLPSMAERHTIAALPDAWARVLATNKTGGGKKMLGEGILFLCFALMFFHLLAG